MSDVSEALKSEYPKGLYFTDYDEDSCTWYVTFSNHRYEYAVADFEGASTARSVADCLNHMIKEFCHE
jgi:hypothetical protein